MSPRKTTPRFTPGVTRRGDLAPKTGKGSNPPVARKPGAAAKALFERGASPKQQRKSLRQAFRAGRKVGRQKMRKQLGGAKPEEELTSPASYVEADIASTSLLRAQGKAYALGREGAEGYRFGASSGAGAKKDEEEEAAGGKRKRKRKKKGLMKSKGAPSKGGQGAKFHVTSKGVVKPSGRPKRPK